MQIEVKMKIVFYLSITVLLLFSCTQNSINTLQEEPIKRKFFYKNYWYDMPKDSVKELSWEITTNNAKRKAFDYPKFENNRLRYVDLRIIPLGPKDDLKDLISLFNQKYLDPEYYDSTYYLVDDEYDTPSLIESCPKNISVFEEHYKWVNDSLEIKVKIVFKEHLQRRIKERIENNRTENGNVIRTAIYKTDWNGYFVYEPWEKEEEREKERQRNRPLNSPSYSQLNPHNGQWRMSKKCIVTYLPIQYNLKKQKEKEERDKLKQSETESNEINRKKEIEQSKNSI